jgi:ATP-dependent HslUV protease ATP-binding subunit HslU
MSTEDIDLVFTEDGLREIARYAAALNTRAENLGARRLYGVMEKVLDELSFRATEFAGTQVVVNADYVRTRMASVPLTDEASKYIL